jgi:uncharacterized protein (DUF433 family)
MSTDIASPGLRHPVSDSLIEIDERGRPWIVGANVKVVEVVLDHLANGFSPAEIHRQYAHLSMAQIHAALSYYYAHQDDMDADIRRMDEDAQRRWQANQDSPGRRRLRGLGLLP